MSTTISSASYLEAQKELRLYLPGRHKMPGPVLLVLV